MDTTDIKRKLIDEINLLDNENLLKELYHYLNQENDIKEIYELNKMQHSAIAEARKEIENNKFLTDKEAKQEIDKWLET